MGRLGAQEISANQSFGTSCARELFCLPDSAIRWSYLTSAAGISAIGSTRSTAPVMIAFRGMPS
jgi:hypothetical protein